MDACSSMGLCNSPVDPSFINPGPVPHNVTPFHGPNVNGHQHVNTQAGWQSDVDQFLSRESDVRGSGLAHHHSGPSDLRRGYADTGDNRRRRDHHGLSDIRPVSIKRERSNSPAFVKVEHSVTPRRSEEQRDEIPPLFRRDPKPRDNQEHAERLRSSGRRSEDRDYSGDRERRRKGLDRETRGSGPRRSRAHSPHPDRMDRAGPSSFDVHRGRSGHHSARERDGNSEFKSIEHRSRFQPSPAHPHQSRGYHSPPPIHVQDYHPPERRLRLDEDYSRPFVNESSRPPSRPPDYSNPFIDNERFGRPPHPPPHGPLSDRLGESPGPLAHSVQARLGPPRITEPLDHNQGIVPFNAGPPQHFRVGETHPHGYPLPDLRQELISHNSMPTPLMESNIFRPIPPYQEEVPPLFRRPPSPNRHRSSSPGRRETPHISPIKAPPLSSMQSRSPPPGYPPLPPRRPPLPVRHPSPPPSCPQSLTKHPPSPPKHPPSPPRSPPSLLKSSLSPGRPSLSHSQSPVRSKPSPAKHGSTSSRQTLSPSGNSRSPFQRRTTDEIPRSKHSTREVSPTQSLGLSKAHHSSLRQRRRSSGQLRSPASDAGTLYM